MISNPMEDFLSAWAAVFLELGSRLKVIDYESDEQDRRRPRAAGDSGQQAA
jgi:hypothetical protein